MERTYLNGWRTFIDRTQNIPQLVSDLLDKDHNLEDIFSAMRALNVCRFQAEAVRDKIGKKFSSISEGTHCWDKQALVDGVVGLAGCTYKPYNAEKMVSKVVKMLRMPLPKPKSGAPQIELLETLSFLQAVELLKGLSSPGVAFKDKQVVKCLELLCTRFNLMSFDMIQNELTFEEFNKLYDAYVNLKFSEVKELRKMQAQLFTNEALVRAFETKSFAEQQFHESYAAGYDPIKPRVMGGVTESLVKVDLQDLNKMQEG